MKTLTLSLKKKWFDMIASGEKTEEYREITPYWQKRLLRCGNACDGYSIVMGEIICPICRYLKYTDFDTVVFTLGYPRKGDLSRRMEFEVSDISIDCGRPEWGAEPDKAYFVIKLGERIRHKGDKFGVSLSDSEKQK